MPTNPTPSRKITALSIRYYKDAEGNFSLELLEPDGKDFLAVALTPLGAEDLRWALEKYLQGASIAAKFFSWALPIVFGSGVLGFAWGYLTGKG